ncbi:MAG: hypothetical protein U1E38_01295 [Rhodospirillales bacterium]
MRSSTAATTVVKRCHCGGYADAVAAASTTAGDQRLLIRPAGAAARTAGQAVVTAVGFTRLHGQVRPRRLRAENGAALAQQQAEE